ncbi:MAG TPA: DNA polymerase III subunit beta [Rhodospirillaceae bacterium]|nr:DNA polymerase III subunit beta [Rhodospirillaceae bacterium]RPG01230.1 MAG: DNA polymerase III subunit beta [Rhodospirillaceae bacterium TMED63]RZO37593.1 MAG: DNA polymerase III subunit beta [Rhodospirillaceae bacterium]HCH57477.1 DNA polymerase III subunit beta [Rhodospirillaceae bacterium]|tara:strand:- start:1398 stop:2516 length:1119 start_codon:yes stop_codon:yes gene_type:complete
MQFTIERSTLLRSLTHVQGVVERRTTIPILSNVLLQANGGKFGLTATDMDLAIIEGVAADVSQDGSTTVPAHTLYDIVRKLPEGSQVEVGAGGEQGQLEIRSGRSKLSLTTLPSEDFPVMSDGDLPHSFTVPARVLRRLIDRTRFAMSTEETRYYLNGLYFHAADSDGVEVLRIVATDGHRLARVEVPIPDGAAGMPGVIVPRKAVGEIYKLIEEVEDDIEIALSETKIRFAFGDAVLTSKLIDGTFPDYDRVIPFGNDKTLEVKRTEFVKAVDLVSTISTEKSRAIKLALEDGNLVLTATSPEAGSAREELDVDYNDDPLEIGFNSKYLLDITQQIEGDDAKFVLSDGASPTLVQDMGDTSALYVLMPMRV